MPNTIYKYDEKLGKVVEVTGVKHRVDANAAHGIIPDFDSPSYKELDGGYRHTITGEFVTSRARHKELLREHNCVEVGNEKSSYDGNPVHKPQDVQWVREHLRGQR